MEETDLEWMRELHARLWPKHGDNCSLDWKPEGELPQLDFDRVLKVIKTHRLLTQMFPSKMFGGYGMRIYEHPIFPGLPPTKLLSITEDHIPGPTQYDHLTGEAKPLPKRKPGEGRTDAWETFSQFTHTEQNRRWLRGYGMTDSSPRADYDY